MEDFHMSSEMSKKTGHHRIIRINNRINERAT